MRTVLAAALLAGVVAAGEAEVLIEVRGGKPVEGTLLDPAPLRVETRYGVVTIPVSDLLSIDPKERLAIAHGGSARGPFDWTELRVQTGYGEARLHLEQVAKVTWKRKRSLQKVSHHVELADGTGAGGSITPEQFEFVTAYGALKVPLGEVRFLKREDKSFRLRLAEMSVRGEPRVETWTLDTAYGVLKIPGNELMGLSRRAMPVEGDRLDGGYVVRAVGSDGGSAYAVVSRAEQMSWEEAKAMAEKAGGHLATVGDAAENGFLCTLFEDMKNEQPWIGFSDEGHEGEWRWVTGEQVRYRNWGPGEPNNSGRCEHHCEFLVSAGGRWNDVDGRTTRNTCVVEFE